MVEAKSDEGIVINETRIFLVPGYDDLFITKSGEVYHRCLCRNKDIVYKYRKQCFSDGYKIIGYKKSTIRVHVLLAKTFIPNPEKKPFVDHINCDRDDNRIQNLRWCTGQENQFNRKKQEGTSSKYIGVCWNKNVKKWMVQIKINRKTKYLGYFDSEIKAAKAYDREARELHGEFAHLNFPDDED